MKEKRKSQKLRDIWIFAAICFCLLSVPVQAADTQKKVVKIGCPVSSGYYLDDTGAGGYGYEYEKLLAQYAGWKIEYVSGSWSDMNEMLKNGEIDLLGFLLKTDERMEEYDYADFASGTSMSCLITSKRGKPYAYEEYDSFNGMTVAYQDSDENLESFQEWCTLHDVKVTTEAYHSNEEIFEALDEGTVEAAVVTNYSDLIEYHIIAKYQPREFYYAVTKGNEELLNELNAALTQIDIYYPELQNDLYDKYYDNRNGHRVFFTEEELAYLEKNPEVTVIFGGRDKPFEYYDSGEKTYFGIVPDILQKMTEITGIEFQYMQLDDSDSIENLSDRGNIMVSFTNDFEWAEQNHLVVTQPFLEGNVSILTKSADTEIQTVALVNNQYINYKIPQLHPDWNITYFDSLEECMNAVKNGKCDGTVMNEYEADYYLSMGQFSLIHEEISSLMTQNLCFGLTEESDPILISIMSKTLLMVDDDTYRSIVAQNMNAARKMDLVDFIYSNTWQFIILMVVMAFLLILAVVLFIKARISYRLIRKMSVEDSVTELQNRNAYERYVERQREHEFEQVCCIYIDVNGLHEMNNRYGHAKGDVMLQCIARNLKKVFAYREVYRIGGDEFVIIVEHQNQQNCEKRMEQVTQFVEAERFFISVGIELREQEQGLDALIRAADEKMLENKKEYYRTHERRIRR